MSGLKSTRPIRTNRDIGQEAPLLDPVAPLHRQGSALNGYSTKNVGDAGVSNDGNGLEREIEK